MKRAPLIAVALLLAGCHSDQCSTPFGEGAAIDIADPQFADLGTVGGSVVVNRGYKGIVVTRTSYADFVAFDCACPNDNDVRLLPDSDWGNSVLTCPTCGSRFNALDGTPLSGAATPCPLYQYSTTFDGQYLTVY